MAHRQKSITRIILGTAIAFLWFSFAHTASAATFYLSPSAGNYLTGHTFTMKVFVSSPDEAMNAVQAAITFPSNKLSVVSLSKSGSIIDLWMQDPAFSNQDGTINFGGIVTNPGFQGSAGTVLAITFQVKNSGTASISFLSGSILANDGVGTNILSGMQNAAVTLTALPAGSGETKPGNVAGLAISSDPAIKDDQWYNFDAITFRWSLPVDADGVSYALSNDPGYQLSKNAQSPVAKVSYDTTTLTDGIWYFYLSFESGGTWSPVTSRTLYLDRTPPDPFIIVPKNQNLVLSNAQPAFQWAATDKTSGVAYYQAKIGDGDWFDPATIVNNSLYVLPEQSPANERTLVVRAYDHAGNFRESSINFSVATKECVNGGWWCSLQYFFGEWNWPLAVAVLLCLLVAYWFIFRVFIWRRKLKKELSLFKDELRHDLKRLEDRVDVSVGHGSEVDLRPSHLAAKKESLEKAAEHLETDIKEEIRKIEKL